MTMYELITKKKHGKELTCDEIEYIISGFTKGEIPDYQMSAFLMAVCLCGMSDEETKCMTLAMANSGDMLDLSMFGTLSCDKHSSGGVGDKTTLIVAPIVASLGGVVAKLSGRGLGHTGGTVDKLEAIDGYRTELSPQEFLAISGEHNICVCGQSSNLAPADKKIYALRDVTATVDCIPLIVSSIMSKKLAAGAHNIMLDVKCGSGAFMKTREDAKMLAEGMVKIGKMCGRNISALVTNMDVPLGNAVGESLEVIEAIDVLCARTRGDIREVSTYLAAGLVAKIKNISIEAAKQLCENAIDEGTAFAKFKEWIEAQGANACYADDTSLFKIGEFTKDIICQRDGYIACMDAEKIGRCVLALGGGRVTKDDVIDNGAGIMLHKKTGAYVKKGEKIATLYTSTQQKLTDAEQIFLCALEFSKDAPKLLPLVLDVVE